MLHNFGSGPAKLHKSVYEQLANALIDYEQTGLSILEIYHRTPLYEAILAEATLLCKELYLLDDTKEVLFMPNGATWHFNLIAQNFLQQKAAYIHTGNWSKKAYDIALEYGKAEIIASSENNNFKTLPIVEQALSGYDYVHITANNTDVGTQFHTYPKSSIPLVADMSSDIFSKPLPINDFALIYAGAQKNIGIAGASLVIIDKAFIKNTNALTPSYYQYKNWVNANSIMNTPPIFAIYAMLVNMRWIKAMGGLEFMHAQAKEKATLLYKTLDNSNLFEVYAQEQDRSLMNVCFAIKDPSIHNSFMHFAKEAGIIQIDGYRTVGGFRVSLYNAIELASVQHLCDVITAFDHIPR